jgi:hypothetical protein
MFLLRKVHKVQFDSLHVVRCVILNFPELMLLYACVVVRAPMRTLFMVLSVAPKFVMIG